MAAGVPVVSSPFGIAADSQLVWQVDTEDPQAWVDAIILADSCRTMKQPAIEVWKQTMNVDRFRDQWKSLLSLPFARSTE
jgi:hypothetical protein